MLFLIFLAIAILTTILFGFLTVLAVHLEKPLFHGLAVFSGMLMWLCWFVTFWTGVISLVVFILRDLGVLS